MFMIKQLKPACISSELPYNTPEDIKKFTSLCSKHKLCGYKYIFQFLKK